MGVLPSLLHVLITLKVDPSAAKLRPALLQWYTEHVIESRDPVAAVTRDAFNLFFPLLTAPEFSSHFLPGISRMLKRTPEAVLPAVLPLLQHVTIDLSPYTMEIVSGVLPELRQTVAPRRAAALAALQSLIRKSSDMTVLRKVLAELNDYLLGKREVLATWDQKAAFLHAIDAMSESEAAVQALGDAAIGTLIDLLEKEGHKDARIVALRSLGHWLLKRPVLPSRAVTFVMNNIAAQVGAGNAKKENTEAHLFLTIAAATASNRKCTCAHLYHNSRFLTVLPLFSLDVLVLDHTAEISKDVATRQLEALKAHIATATAKPFLHSNRQSGLLATALLVRVGAAQDKMATVFRPVLKEPAVSEVISHHLYAVYCCYPVY